MEIKIKIEVNIWEKRYFIVSTLEELILYLNITYGKQGEGWDFL